MIWCKSSDIEGKEMGDLSPPQHTAVSPNVIEEGDLSMTEDGVPIERHGHRAQCCWMSASSPL
ncbi:hypothetical protein BOC59_02575 [Burkholderia pseudomallei]|nr:hypothetical protein BOC59_02575 [Burkholderia pseudomallei]